MKNYKAGIYLRLSKEDRQSNNSIDMQREITSNYAQKNNYEVVKEYVDNGYSGILDSRPALNEMIFDITRKKIDMVIVKDISRLTRDKNLTGFYTDIFFPDNDVRFISVTEYIDSGEIYEIDDTISLRGIINQCYLEDISRKIKAVKTNFKEEGKFIEGSVLYGYKKDKKDKYKLVIDEPAAKVVRKIFELFLSGKQPLEIADYFNSKNIPTPSQYKKSKVISKYWSKGIVNRILNDLSYTGKIILNKYYNDFRLKRRMVTKIKDLKYIDDVHEAIISDSDFKKVREIKESRVRGKTKRNYEFLLRDLVYCENCGRKMVYKNFNPIYSDDSDKVKRNSKEQRIFYM